MRTQYSHKWNKYIHKRTTMFNKKASYFLLNYSWFRVLCVLVLGVQSDFVIHVYILFFLILSYDTLLQEIEYSSLFCTVKLCCLSQKVTLVSELWWWWWWWCEDFLFVEFLCLIVTTGSGCEDLGKKYRIFLRPVALWNWPHKICWWRKKDILIPSWPFLDWGMGTMRDSEGDNTVSTERVSPACDQCRALQIAANTLSKLQAQFWVPTEWFMLQFVVSISFYKIMMFKALCN